MKRKPLPDSFEKRKLLYDKKIPREQLAALGELFLEEGRPYEAAEFFRRASFQEGLDRLCGLAAEQGDSCLLEFALRGSTEGAHRADWKALGSKAMELRKYSHAVRAFRKAGDADLLREAEEALKEVLSIEQA
jgi:hypothetical protein